MANKNIKSLLAVLGAIIFFSSSAFSQESEYLLWMKQLDKGEYRHYSFSTDGSKIGAVTTAGEFIVYDSKTGEELYIEKFEEVTHCHAKENKFLVYGRKNEGDERLSYHIDESTFELLKTCVSGGCCLAPDKKNFWYTGAWAFEIADSETDEIVHREELEEIPYTYITFFNLKFPKDNKFILGRKTLSYSPGGGGPGSIFKVYDRNTFEEIPGYSEQIWCETYSYDGYGASKYQREENGEKIEGIKLIDIEKDSLVWEFDETDDEFGDFIFGYPKMVFIQNPNYLLVLKRSGFVVIIDYNNKSIVGKTNKMIYGEVLISNDNDFFVAKGEDLLFVYDFDKELFDASQISSENPDEKLTVYPNPTSSEAKIGYYAETPSEIRLELVTPTGESVLLLDDFAEKGHHEFLLDTSVYSSGQYFIRLTTNTATESQPLIIAK